MKILPDFYYQCTFN